jgi:pilus assembly protein Flp/PilA
LFASRQVIGRIIPTPLESADPNLKTSRSMDLRLLNSFAAEETGATAIEYGLIAALIGCVLTASLQALGWEIYNRFAVMVTAVNGS